MADPWINRLVIAGPVKDVKAFAKAAAGFEPPDFDGTSKNLIRLSLSFTALYNLLPAATKRRVPEVESEPYQLKSERLVTRKDGNGEKIYRFELWHYKPDALLNEFSKLFPRLCFIWGWIAPNVGEAASKFIRNGRTREYWMPHKIRGELRAGKYKEWGSECLDADIEANWLMLDGVVAHWHSALAAGLKTGGRRKLSSRVARQRVEGNLRSRCEGKQNKGRSAREPKAALGRNRLGIYAGGCNAGRLHAYFGNPGSDRVHGIDSR